jgi:hypothetical protein
LGAGEMRYAMENPNNGDMIFIHHDHYSNENDDVHLDNPSLKIGYVAAELSGNSGLGVTVCGASVMGAIEGYIAPIDYSLAAYSVRNTSISADTITHLLSVKGNLVSNNKINSRELIIKKLTCGATVAGGAPAVVFLYLEPTYASTPVFEKLGNASAFSITSTTVSGTLLAVFSIASGSPQTIDVSDLRIVLPPRTKIALAISSSAQINRVDSAITFIED